MSRTREKIIAKSIIDYFEDEGGLLNNGITQTVDHIQNIKEDSENADFLMTIIDKPIVTKDKTFDLSGKYKGGAFTLFVINILTNELSKVHESKEEQMTKNAAERVKEIFNFFKENIMNYILHADKEYDSNAVKAVLSKLQESLISFENPNIFDAYDLILETQDKLKPLLYNIDHDKKIDKSKSSLAKHPENNPQKIVKLKQLATALAENPLSDEKFKGKFVKNYVKLLEKLDRYPDEGLVSSAYCTSFKAFCEKQFKEKYEEIIAEQERQIDKAPKKSGFSLLHILRVKEKKREKAHLLSPTLSPGLSSIDGLTSPSLASPPPPILSARSKSSSSPEEQQNPSPPSLSSTTSPSEGSDLPHSVSKSPTSISPVEKKEPVPASAAATVASKQSERRRSIAGRFQTDRQLGPDGRIIFREGASLFDKFNLHDEDDEENDRSKKKTGLSRSSVDSD